MVDPVTFGTVGAVGGKPPATQAPAKKTDASAVTNVKIEGEKSLPKLISLARQLAEQGPPVDFTKIAQIRNAIAEGSYAIDNDNIAEAMLGFAAKEAK